MREGIRYRPPGWWTAAAVGLLVTGALGALAGGRVVFLAATLGFGSVTLFVARRSWAHVSADGLEVCPNGVRVVRASWEDVVDVVGHRIVLADGNRVTVPPLAGDPLAHVVAEVAHRTGAPGAGG